MIIFGWSTRQRVLETGLFHCPVCKSQAAYSRVGQRRWFTLFFIPVIPLSDTEEIACCNSCATLMPMQRLTGRADSTSNRKVPSLATVGMVMGVFSLLTVCIVFFSLPMAIAAVILGHMGLSTIRKNQAEYQGEWQAIVAMSSGYATLALGTLFVAFAVLAPRILPRDAEFASHTTTSDRDDEAITGDKSTIEALRSAENAILGKRGESAVAAIAPKPSLWPMTSPHA